LVVQLQDPAFSALDAKWRAIHHSIQAPHLPARADFVAIYANNRLPVHMLSVVGVCALGVSHVSHFKQWHSLKLIPAQAKKPLHTASPEAIKSHIKFAGKQALDGEYATVTYAPQPELIDLHLSALTAYQPLVASSGMLFSLSLSHVAHAGVFCGSIVLRARFRMFCISVFAAEPDWMHSHTPSTSLATLIPSPWNHSSIGSSITGASQ
jgi:hypothetical protein